MALIQRDEAMEIVVRVSASLESGREEEMGIKLVERRREEKTWELSASGDERGEGQEPVGRRKRTAKKGSERRMWLHT